MEYSFPRWISSAVPRTPLMRPGPSPPKMNKAKVQIRKTDLLRATTREFLRECKHISSHLRIPPAGPSGLSREYFQKDPARMRPKVKRQYTVALVSYLVHHVCSAVSLPYRRGGDLARGGDGWSGATLRGEVHILHALRSPD